MNKTLRATILSILAATGTTLVSTTGCRRNAPAPATTAPTITAAHPVSADDVLTAMNTAAVGLKEAKTSVQKADVIAAVNKAAQDALTGKELEAEFIIKDVQMLSADKARITVSSLNTPVYSKQPKSISLNLAGTWDLPLTTDKARTIEPGQHLLLRGPAAFSPTEGILSLSMPRPNAMARITYIGDAPGAFHGGVLTLAPKKYAITRP